MKKITLLFALITCTLLYSQEAIITGYVDATCPGAAGRVLEIYTHGTIDYTGWAVQRQSNGNGYSTTIDLSSFGEITDEFIYITNDQVVFEAEFGITNNVAENTNINSNGNDAFQIIDASTVVIDRFGEENVDGAGTAWEHTDSFYLRNAEETANAGAFDAANWTFGALDALDGEGVCNGANVYSTLVALGSFTPAVVVTPEINFLAAVASVNEDDGSLFVTIEISEAPTTEATVEVSLAAGGTATETTDFTFSSTQTVTFNAGSSDPQVISIPIVDNNDDDSDLFFALTLENAVNATVGSGNLFSAYILDDDTVVPTPDASELDVNYLASYTVDSDGTAEISAYDPISQRVFVTNSDTIEVLDFSDPSNITSLTTMDVPAGTGGVQSVAINNGIVAYAVSADPKTDPGFVILSDVDGTNQISLNVGALPDMLTFSPDGNLLVVANEGEPNADYSVDPEGSISVIDVTGGLGGISQANVTTINFNAFDGSLAALVASGVRIFGPGATVSQDLEPEYVAIDSASEIAYVTLQENNAYAIVDLVNLEITAILPFGTKDHSLPENSLDLSDETDFIFDAAWPVRGMYMPDAVATYSVGGVSYVVTANEGDAREYDTFEEERKIDDSDYTLDPTVFSNIELLELESNLAEIAVTNASGDIDGDGLFEEIHVFGGRSFSIFEANSGILTYDSGNDFEVITAADPTYGPIFNASNSNNNFKNRSDNKGPEPEGITLAVIDGQTYAFILLERIGGVMVYNITDPTNPEFLQYLNNRDATPGGDEMGDLGPEGIIYIAPEDSPVDTALLVISNETSGTLSIYALDNVLLGTSEISFSSGTNFTVFPNPAQHQVSLSKLDTYQVYDLSGKHLLTSELTNQLDVSYLQSGIYLISNSKGITQKLVIK